MKCPKRLRLWGIALFLLLLALALALFCLREQSRPSFDDLRTEDVDHIAVIYGDEERPARDLSEEDQELLVSYLQQVELGRKVPNYMDYDGTVAWMFSLYMKNGDVINIGASSPRLIVDNMGYQSDYELCHAISDIYWRYMDMIRAENGPPNISWWD